MLFFPIITLYLKDGSEYPLRNGEIQTYPLVYSLLSKNQVKIIEKHQVMNIIGNLQKKEEMSEALRPYLEEISSMWEK